MTTTHFAEPNYTAEFLISEEDEAYYSRDAVTLKSGNNLKAGAVLGRVVTAGSATATAGTNTGNGAFGAVTVGANAQPGVYTVKITKAAANAGDFEVIDPQGDVVGLGTVGSAFSGAGLGFTVADGATDFAVGDSWTVVVTVSAQKWTEFAPAATDGSQLAAAILYADVDASLADTPAVIIARAASVKLSKLAWAVGVTDAQKATAIAQLGNAGIVVRS